MTYQHEASQRSIVLVTPEHLLHGCVRRALYMRRARLYSAVAAAGLASVTPLALGAAFPAVFPLGSLLPAGGGDGSRGFVLTGIDGSDESGYALSAAGDVNGDGIADLIVATPNADPGGNASAGESYVVFGSTQGFPPIIQLRSLFPAAGGDGSRGFVLTGIDAGDGSGHSVSAAGDVNADGIDDLIVGAPQADPGGDIFAGESYVVFGSTQGFPAIVSLGSLFPASGGDGSRGFVLTGIEERDASGDSVSAAGDVNGDGIDDLIVGAPGAGPAGAQGAGESYVVFGSTQDFPAVFPLGRLLPEGGGDGSRGFVLEGIDDDDFSGSSVSAAGDVNGDGIDDLIIGAGGADPGGGFADEQGESYVVFGSTQGFPAVFPLESLLPEGGGDGSRGFVLEGIDDYDFSGQSVSAAGDVNGDGIDDVIIAAPFASRLGAYDGGESYVVFGSTQGFPAIVQLESLLPSGGGDGTRGFVVASFVWYQHAGWSVSSAGDIDGNGIDDLLIGTFHGFVGENYVVLGSMQAFPAIVELKSLFPAGGGDGSRGFVLRNNFSYAGAASVSDAGDVNGDGVDDVIISNPGAGPGGERYAGESYVVFGRASAP